MWLLTVVLLLATGTDKVVTVPMDNGGECYIAKQRALSMNEYGLHVLTASCSEGSKDA